VATHSKLRPYPPDRPALLHEAALQVAGQIRKAKLRQQLGAARLPDDCLRPPTPLPGGQLPSGPPSAPDAVLVHQPPDRPAVGAEFGGHLGQQPSPHQQPISQVRPEVGEAELGGQLWEAQAGVAASLQVAAQVGKSEALGASFQLAGAVVVVDRKPAVDDQVPRCLRW
jgi:hypothetical protein